MTLEDPVSAEAIAFGQQIRKNRLTVALSTGAVAKIMAVIVQWLALPLALKSLGTDRYAAFLTLQSLVAWANLLALGLAPSLPRFISEASVAGNREIERDIFQTAIIYLFAIGSAFALVMAGLGCLIPPSNLIGIHNIPQDQVLWAYGAVILITGFQLVGNVMPSIRGGYQELHYSYAWAATASLTVVIGLHYATAGKSTIAGLLFIIYGPIVMFMMADLVLVTLQRPYLLHNGARFARTARLLAPQASNALAAQFSYFLVSFLPTLIVTHLSGAQATAAFGSVMQILVLAGSGMNLIYQPLVPAIADAFAHNDRSWIRRAYFRAACLVALICGVGLLINIFFGNYLLDKWLGTDLKIPHLLPLALAIYFTVWMVNVMHFNILAATGTLNRVGKAYLIEGFLSISCGSLLTHFYGATGMAAGLAFGATCVNLWFLSLQVWRHVLSL